MAVRGELCAQRLAVASREPRPQHRPSRRHLEKLYFATVGAASNSAIPTRRSAPEWARRPVDIYVLTLKRYAGALAPIRVTFIEDQQDRSAPWLKRSVGGRRLMKSTIVKHSIMIAGHKTSVSLEDQFWSGLKAIAD